MTGARGAPLVLVLEDDPGSAQALAGLLADWGYDCVYGASLELVAEGAARRLVEARAIISDYELQDGADGLAAIAGLSGLGVAAPALVLTGALGGQPRRAARAAGHQFMEKPVAPRRLKAWLERIAHRDR